MDERQRPRLDRSPEARQARRERMLNSQKLRLVSPNEAQQQWALRDELQAEIGAGYGDWIRFLAKPIAEVAGKKGCTACEARRIVTNAYGRLKEKHGSISALSMIKDLWALSMKADGDEVLMKLRGLLNDSDRA